MKKVERKTRLVRNTLGITIPRFIADQMELKNKHEFDMYYDVGEKKIIMEFKNENPKAE